MAKSETFVLTFSPGEIQAGGGVFGLCCLALSCSGASRHVRRRLTGNPTMEGETGEWGLTRRVDKVGESCKTQTQVKLSLRRKLTINHWEWAELPQLSGNNLAKTGCSCSSYKCLLMRVDEEQVWWQEQSSLRPRLPEDLPSPVPPRTQKPKNNNSQTRSWQS